MRVADGLHHRLQCQAVQRLHGPIEVIPGARPANDGIQESAGGETNEISEVIADGLARAVQPERVDGLARVRPEGRDRDRRWLA